MSEQREQPKLNMGRDELKNILYEWLREKGILGELQAFIQKKMVEKLTLEGMVPGSLTEKSLSSDEEIQRLIIFDYLSQEKLHYTTSVLRVESSAKAASDTPYSPKSFRRNLIKGLQHNDPFREMVMSAPENCSLLGHMIQIIVRNNAPTETNLLAEKLEKKVRGSKLCVNVHTQTTLIHDSKREARNTRNLKLPTVSNNQELLILKSQKKEYKLSKYTHVDNHPQSQLFDQNVNQLPFSLLDTAHNTSTTTLNDCQKTTTDERLLGEPSLLLHRKRVEKAHQFLGLLNDRLSCIDRRYRNAIISQDPVI